MNISDFILRYWLFIVLYEAVCAFASSGAADLKRRDQGYWFILGLLLGVFALAAVLIMKKRPEELAPKNNLLLDSEQYLRSGWRVVLFLVAIIAIYYVSAILAKLTGIVPMQSFFFLFYIDVIIATYLLIRFVDRRRFFSVGIPYHGRIMKELLLGFLIGVIMIGAVGGVELAVGAIKLDMRPGQNWLLVIRNFGLSFIFFGYFAMGEELVFRGYPFQALIEGTGAVGATILMSVFFGIMHLANPSADFLSTLNTMLAGVWLCLAYLKTRTLYFPFGMHFSWNLVQSFFLPLAEFSGDFDLTRDLEAFLGGFVIVRRLYSPIDKEICDGGYDHDGRAHSRLRTVPPSRQPIGTVVRRDEYCPVRE